MPANAAPTIGPPTEQHFVDLWPNLKNSSTMRNYNTHTPGRGGVCDLWSGGIEGEKGWSYWCGDHSDGGGAGWEQLFLLKGNLGFPVAVHFNATQQHLPSFASWVLPPQSDWGPGNANLPLFHAFQSPGWATSSFAITGVDKAALRLNLGYQSAHE